MGFEWPDKVARNEGSGGWEHGLLVTIAEVAEEQVDTAAWLRGLDQYPLTAEQLDRIVNDSRLIWDELREIAQRYSGD